MCSVLSIGNFDGVHLGHQRILQRLVDLAKQQGCRSVVFTFDSHPAYVLNPDARPETLTPREEKQHLLTTLGVYFTRLASAIKNEKRSKLVSSTTISLAMPFALNSACKPKAAQNPSPSGAIWVVIPILPPFSKRLLMASLSLPVSFMFLILYMFLFN
jgi:hypothetical protein